MYDATDSEFKVYKGQELQDRRTNATVAFDDYSRQSLWERSDLQQQAKSVPRLNKTRI